MLRFAMSLLREGVAAHVGVRIRLAIAVEVGVIHAAHALAVKVQDAMRQVSTALREQPIQGARLRFRAALPEHIGQLAEGVF